MRKLLASNRIMVQGSSLAYVRYHDDLPPFPITALWNDTQSGSGMNKVYVVQTTRKVIERCLLMATDPGDLVLDPTCGSGTTAYVAEQWGPHSITIDTSRIASPSPGPGSWERAIPTTYSPTAARGRRRRPSRALCPEHAARSRQRATGIRLRAGAAHHAEKASPTTPRSTSSTKNGRPRWNRSRAALDEALKHSRHTGVGGMESPREADAGWHGGGPHGGQPRLVGGSGSPPGADRRASIAAKAGCGIPLRQALPTTRKRSASQGPLRWRACRRIAASASTPTILSSIPHSTQARGQARSGRRRRRPVCAGDPGRSRRRRPAGPRERQARVLVAGPLAGRRCIAAEGRYADDAKGATGREKRRPRIFIGPEYGTVSHNDLSAAAREALEAGFDLLVACGFDFEAVATEFSKLGPLPILKARMNADLHMADDLRTTGKGISLRRVRRARHRAGACHVGAWRRPAASENRRGGRVSPRVAGEVRSDNADGIACWFIDTDYDEQSFFVRHAYFLQQGGDPAAPLQTTLKAEIDADAWESLRSDTSRPFAKPAGGPDRREGDQPPRRRSDESVSGVRAAPQVERVLHNPSPPGFFDPAVAVAFPLAFRRCSLPPRTAPETARHGV